MAVLNEKAYHSVLSFCSGGFEQTEGEQLLAGGTREPTANTLKSSSFHLSENQKRMIQMRKELKCNKEIAATLGLNVTYVYKFLEQYFNGDDPLDMYVLRSFKAGKFAKEIARELQIPTQIVTNILRKHGINPWHEYLKKTSAHFNQYGISKQKHREKRNQLTLARDLYCFYLDGLNLEDIALTTGYSPGYISHLFNKFIPGYHEQSLLRRKKSKDNKSLLARKKLSRKFRTEAEFQSYCETILKDFELMSREKHKSDIEVDIIVGGEVVDILIELKVRTRKADACKALGQAILTRQTYKGRCESVICVPDDVDYYPGFERAVRSVGIYLMRASALKQTVEKLLTI